MPEYLAPGVYVEETSFRAKSIEGVGTSTAAFVGLTARGPISSGQKPARPQLLTSYADFERIYGGLDQLKIGSDKKINHVAHAARAFFNNGGGRLYVARIEGTSAATASSGVLNSGNSVAPDKQVKLEGRTSGGAEIPGKPGVNFHVMLVEEELETTKELAENQPAGTLVKSGSHYYVMGTNPMEKTASAPAFSGIAAGAAVSIISLGVVVSDATGTVYEAGALGFHEQHPRYCGKVLGAEPPKPSDALLNPVVLTIGNAATAFELRAALMGSGTTREVELTGGTDGTGAPSSGKFDEALKMLLGLEDISIVAAPGSSDFGDTLTNAVHQLLTSHAQARRSYRIALLDPPQDQLPDNVRSLKSKLDSKYTALYYPWIKVANPVASTDPQASGEMFLPPSGFVAGIYARNDVQRGVHKAPANETVTGALGLQYGVRFGEQEMLNPLGVNCIRELPNRGIRVWGARTTSSDPEWKYVSDRRFFLYLEASIDKGTQWAVFEPNGEDLWANVRTTIEDFLYNEWVNGRLLGASPKEAFFVHCDRSTMTQNDLDNGRLVCLIGVATLKPAEFVIFRIGQKTADSRD